MLSLLQSKCPNLHVSDFNQVFTFPSRAMAKVTQRDLEQVGTRYRSLTQHTPPERLVLASLSSLRTNCLASMYLTRCVWLLCLLDPCA